MINNNLPQQVEEKVRYGLLTWVSKTSVKGLLLQVVAILGIGVMSGFLVAFTTPQEIVVKKYFTRIDTVVKRDTIRHFKSILINKDWGTKSNMVRSSEVPTNKKSFKTVTGKKRDYSVYEKRIWMLKTDESFRKEAYKDGDYYSIGFGFNMNDTNYKLLERLGKLHLIKGRWNSRHARVTWEDGSELTQIYIDHNINPGIKKLEQKRGQPYTDDQKVALACKAYNSGNFTLGKCCKGKKKKGYCQSDDKDTAKAHNHRRSIELQLFNGKFPAWKWETIKQAATQVQVNHK
jgi:GH24 family phage-related lysozyme (muramidase)